MYYVLFYQMVYLTTSSERVAREQGVASFWRGNLTNCLRVAPTSAMRFTLMDHFQAVAALGLPAEERKAHMGIWLQSHQLSFQKKTLD